MLFAVASSTAATTRASASASGIFETSFCVRHFSSITRANLTTNATIDAPARKSGKIVAYPNVGMSGEPYRKCSGVISPVKGLNPHQPSARQAISPSSTVISARPFGISSAGTVIRSMSNTVKSARLPTSIVPSSSSRNEA